MIRLISFAFLVSLMVGFMTVNEVGPLKNLVEDDRTDLWKQFRENQQKGLPKSAIEDLKKIYDSAVGDEAWPEATLAQCTRFFLEGQIDQPVYPYVIRQMQAAATSSPEAMQPVMKTLLAKYYFCLLYTSPSPRDQRGSRMPSSA